MTTKEEDDSNESEDNIKLPSPKIVLSAGIDRQIFLFLRKRLWDRYMHIQYQVAVAQDGLSAALDT
jgi:hypothetical protein